MVIRYYGSKEKLFAAAARFDLRMPDLSALPRDRLGAALAEHFLRRWEEDDTLMVLLRAGVTNKAAAGRMRAIFGAQVAPLAAHLWDDQATAATRAGLVSSQVLGFALCRYVLRLPPIVGMSRADAAAVSHGDRSQRRRAGCLTRAECARPRVGGGLPGREPA